MKTIPGTSIKLIELSEEQKKSIMPVQEYAKELEGNTFGDYYSNRSPVYERLLEVSHYQPGLYSQYAAALRADAIKKGHKAAYIDGVLNWIKIGNLSITGSDSDILDCIHAVASDSRTADKVSVLPLLCGSGKSTALTMLIQETIQRIEKAQKRVEKARKAAEAAGKSPDDIFVKGVSEQDFDGLLIVTDSKERVRKYWSPDTENENISQKTREFIEEHKDNWVTTITEENKADERVQLYTPVLCITTQRYFGWSRDDIIRHLEWRTGEQKHRRPLIVFDEQPFLNAVRDISVQTINDIDTSLRMLLDDEVSAEAKQWCCEQWDKFRAKFFKLLTHYEYDFDGLDTLYYQPEEHSITDDDAKFFSIIEANKKKIRGKDRTAYTDLQTIRQMMNSWAVFSHRSIATGEYNNKFTVFVDSREKVTNLGAKVIVLDGTGDISPLYSDLDYIDLRSGVSFLRSLSYLTVALCDFATDKQEYRKDGNNIANAVKKYLEQEGHEAKDTAFFTFKGSESKFATRVNGKKIDNVAHFGDIKGRNDYTDRYCFAQAGLFQMQPVHYLVHLLGRHNDMRQDIASREPKNAYEQIQAVYQDDRYSDFMVKHILADVDQCLFRSAIRNAANTEDVTYYLFYEQSTHKQLSAEIEKRYKKLGANIRKVDNASILDAAGTGKKAWLIRAWVESWDGTPIKQGELRERLGMSRSTFNNTIARSPGLSELFESFKRDARELGYGNGWYAIKRTQK